MFTLLRRVFQRSTSTNRDGQAHLTFGKTSIGRSVSRTRLILKKQLWIWPIIAIVVLAAVGFGLRSAIERTMRENLQSQLETMLNVERSMLETWLRVQESHAESLANGQHVRDIAAEILKASQSSLGSQSGTTRQPPPPNSARPPLDDLHAQLGRELGPGMSAHGFISYFVADKDQRVVSSSNLELIGQSVKEHETFVGHALEGRVAVSPPFASRAMLKDQRGRLRTGVPTMYVCAPVRDESFQAVAALGLRTRPERDFTRILQLGQLGKSGETYAIDRNGLMVSSSRFDEELILLGLLPDTEDSASILMLSVSDPGGNVQEGYRPAVRRAELPLTKAAASTVAGGSGIDLDGYRDYRGVPVVGAWQWLPRYDMGIITEIDHAEAYRPLTILRWVFFSVFALLALSSVAIFIFTLVVARLQRDAQKAAIDAKHLGQYRLEEKIGAGGMGVVYRGHHAMLRRPTAIKLLSVDKVNEASIARFEREVQITSQLNHPNTVAIYDYGRTPEGVFYYAMEYLDGIDLQFLVDHYGAQPEGRVIHILKQMCGSLYEAHSLGLVHRDIKPANVMLNRRGGEADVVKVLDFGLVKALDDAKRARQTGGLSGTPLYMSPEAIQTPELVDPRSDLYAVGAIGYFLITGQPVFNANSLVELCQQHVSTIPDAPARRLGRPVSPELEAAILACLEKRRDKRPQTARDLAALLNRPPAAGNWSLEDAEAWWGRHDRSQAPADPLATRITANGKGGESSVIGGTQSAGDFSLSPRPSDSGASKSAFEQTMAIDES
jgi:eukaryotic-like serine/threonine-protein kinase